MYLLSGPGVDKYPEIGLFSIEDHENGRIYVHRPVDRETTPSFMVPKFATVKLAQEPGSGWARWEPGARFRGAAVRRAAPWQA